MPESPTDFYERHYVATVSISQGKLRVLGGKEEKRRLRDAKHQTETCYVKELPSRAELQLVLDRGHWIVKQRKDPRG